MTCSFTVRIRPGRNNSRIKAYEDIPHLIVVWNMRDSIVDSIHAHVPDLDRSWWEALLSHSRPLPIGCDQQVVDLLFAIGKLHCDRFIAVVNNILDGGVEEVADSRSVLRRLVENTCAVKDTVSIFLSSLEDEGGSMKGRHKIPCCLPVISKEALGSNEVDLKEQCSSA